MIWELEYRARPWLLNEERAGGRRGAGGQYGRARLTREWREAFANLCLEIQVPPLEWFTVEAIPICRDRRRPDVGNIFPAVKAAIDGLVDAGVAPDDTDAFLHALTFRPALILGFAGVRLRISGEPCSSEEVCARERAHRKRLVKAFVG
jgi:hypothetical protein